MSRKKRRYRKQGTREISRLRCVHWAAARSSLKTSTLARFPGATNLEMTSEAQDQTESSIPQSNLLALLRLLTGIPMRRPSWGKTRRFFLPGLSGGRG